MEGSGIDEMETFQERTGPLALAVDDEPPIRMLVPEVLEPTGPAARMRERSERERDR